jgi:Ca2+/Na+ antiporter
MKNIRRRFGLTTGEVGGGIAIIVAVVLATLFIVELIRGHH